MQVRSCSLPWNHSCRYRYVCALQASSPPSQRVMSLADKGRGSDWDSGE